MQLTIDFKEIEALVLAKTGLEISLRASGNELRLQPRNMGLMQNRVKIRVKIDDSYMVTNRLKLHISAGVFSSLVVPKIMSLLDFMPEGSVARQNDGTVYVMFDKIPQLESVTSNFRVNRIDLDDNFKRMMVDVVFSEESGVDVNAIPPAIEDSWSETTCLKDREIGNTFIGIARSIFESDRVDEGLQTLRDKVTELKDAHSEELKEAALSFLKKMRNESSEEARN